MSPLTLVTQVCPSPRKNLHTGRAYRSNGGISSSTPLAQNETQFGRAKTLYFPTNAYRLLRKNYYIAGDAHSPLKTLGIKLTFLISFHPETLISISGSHSCESRKLVISESFG
jgi:hypothetical protein